jgi:hypothetical protein
MMFKSNSYMLFAAAIVTGKLANFLDKIVDWLDDGKEV